MSDRGFNLSQLRAQLTIAEQRKKTAELRVEQARVALAEAKTEWAVKTATAALAEAQKELEIRNQEVEELRQQIAALEGAE